MFCPVSLSTARYSTMRSFTFCSPKWSSSRMLSTFAMSLWSRDAFAQGSDTSQSR